MSDMRDRDAPPGGGTTDDLRAGDASTRRSPIPETDSDRSAFAFRERADNESIPELLRRLADQGSHLAQQQAHLVEAEIRSSVNDLKQAAGAMAGAAVVGIAGLGVLLMGLSFLLGEVMELWLATLIVAAATLGGAYAMFLGGKKKIQSSSLSADRSRRMIERAPGAISGHTNEVRDNGR